MFWECNSAHDLILFLSENSLVIFNLNLIIITSMNEQKGGVTVRINGEQASLTQIQNVEVTPLYSEMPDGRRTSVGTIDKQIAKGRETALRDGVSFGLVYLDYKERAEKRDAEERVAEEAYRIGIAELSSLL